MNDQVSGTPVPTFKVGSKVRQKGFKDIYTVCRVNGDGTINVKWNGVQYRNHSVEIFERVTKLDMVLE